MAKFILSIGAMLALSPVVTGCTITGRVTDPYGRSVKQAEVLIVDVSEGTEREPFKRGRTNTFGYYNLSLPCERDYEVLVYAKGLEFEGAKVSLAGNVEIDFEGWWMRLEGVKVMR